MAQNLCHGLFNKSMGSAVVHVCRHDQGATLCYCKQGKKKTADEFSLAVGFYG